MKGNEAMHSAQSLLLIAVPEFEGQIFFSLTLTIITSRGALMRTNTKHRRTLAFSVVVLQASLYSSFGNNGSLRQ
jgi:hypothetical protein